MKHKTFEEFYNNIGFEEYPFFVFTSEQETQRSEQLFIGTSMYSPIVQSFINGNTIILAGDRGTGKTAVLYDFLRRSDEKSMIVSISDFSSLSQGYKQKDFYKFVIVHISECFFAQIESKESITGNLSKEDRIRLAYFYHAFAKTSTREALKRRVEKLQTTRAQKIARRSYKALKTPLNAGANFLVQLITDLVAKSIGTAQTEYTWSEYFPEMRSGVDTAFNSDEVSYGMLEKLVTLIKKCGISNVTLVFDKIDEDSRLENASEEIADFIEPLLTDNKFLLDPSLQLIISIWVIPFNQLKDKVRTQKLNCPVLSWSDEDLIMACERRMSVFSNEKVTTMAQIYNEDVDEDIIKQLFELCNRNPRDLWHIMNKISLSQYKKNSSSVTITRSAISDGIAEFVRNFNFYEYYPKRSNARANSIDIYAYVKHLMKLDDIEFTRNQLNEKAATGSSTQNYVASMESIGLVERTGTSSGAITYKIRDPKVIYASRKRIEIGRSQN